MLPFKARLLRARRKLFEAQQRTCKNCGKDYEETENYNWSCRTHHSEYGGEMWWCCGKLGKNAPGCRFSKHESKDDDEELDAEEKLEKEAVSFPGHAADLAGLTTRRGWRKRCRSAGLEQASLMRGFY